MLGEQAIGEHRFLQEPQTGYIQLRSEAHFGLRVFGRTFAYHHESVERWRGDCLERIESKTDNNGRAYAVTGVRENDHFQVRTLNAAAELPACVMSGFAYWNPVILQQQRLLNPQNGEYEDVTVDAKGEESVTTRHGAVSARRYTINSRKTRIDAWYTPDGRWVGLEWTTDIGLRLRYVLE
jgi:hypothetical protein